MDFRPLLRKNQQLNKEECIKLLQTEKRAVLSVIGDNGYPYGVPINHYYSDEDGHIYIHGGCYGHRVDAVRKNNKISLCVYNQGELSEDGWSYIVKSVIVFGKAIEVEDKAKIARISTELSRKFMENEEEIQKEVTKDLHRTLLLEIIPENITGKIVREK